MTPDDFPVSASLYESQPVVSTAPSRARAAAGALSQSERDWAYAKRSLARGRSPVEVITAIAAHRTDKHNPLYYARLTMQKAALAIANDPRTTKYRGAKR